ncbi:MAG: XTP/dITP diphosphatase [Clostridiales bacterium]|nr:XTP/dITP diphosphatase [Clostridiales bacterium]
MKLVIASNNKHKIVEIKKILQDDFDEILSMSEAGLDEDIEETGITFKENALIKAHYVSDKLNCVALADDSGLEVDALDCRPGVYSARYCGYHGDDDANNKKLLDEMKDKANKSARYACAIALVQPNEKDLVAMGYCEGTILEIPQGNGGFGYDPLFYMKDFNQTMAQLDIDIKNNFSHRYHALMGVKKLLEESNE